MAIDLRSDTVTKPTPEMREKMAEAEVGDDVYGEDPTVNRLESIVAEKFARESALYVPSGSMGNQVSVNVHTEPGDEVILDSDCHIFNYEMGTMSSFSGVMPRPIDTEDSFLPIERVREVIRPDEYYVSKTGLITLENTHNVKGGVVYPLDKTRKIVGLAEEFALPVHLDGARIFNAAIASGNSVKELTKGVDSVMFCLSKGLGAPIGSMVVGDEEFIQEARVARKRLGGGMRQVGILAAAGIHALNNHVERLEEDHRNAKVLAGQLQDLDGLEVNPPETNILILNLEDTIPPAETLSEELKDRGVLISSFGPRKVRLVTHLGVTEEDVKIAAEAIKSVLE